LIPKGIRVSGISKILEQMRSAPQNVRYAELAKVCEHHFGTPRQRELATPSTKRRG
jgi:CRISPR/Cas system endoribonuclease Cas6 (RAMP superfamily)